METMVIIDPVKTEGKVHNVMVALVCENIYPLMDYHEVSEDIRGRRIPMTYMIIRWDGTFGYPGGRVDSDEDIRNAAKREVLEEIGYELKPEDLIYIRTIEVGNSENHLYAYRMTNYDFVHLASTAPQADHYWSECQGICPIKLAITGDKSCFTNMLKQRFIGNAPERLMDIFNKYGVDYTKQ